MVKLALISSFPPEYAGTVGANLAAYDEGGSSICIKSPSPRLGVNNITLLNPGSGSCGGGVGVVALRYTLAQYQPAGTAFARWECSDVISGTALPIQGNSSVTLAANLSVTCVAVYTMAAASAPAPSPR